MSKVLNVFVFDGFKHHIEAILDIVLCPARHQLYNFRPFVADTHSFFQNQDVFFYAEGVFLDVRIQKIDPSLATLLSISRSS